jgi:carbamate kinase
MLSQKPAVVPIHSQQQQQQQQQQQHIVVALGGNALLKRGEEMTMENQRSNIAQGMKTLASIVENHKTTIVHGNGPQVGLLMLESAEYEKSTGLKQISLDVLDAETEGMIGYLIEQELHNHLLNKQRGLVTVLSQIAVDPNDPAFDEPTKFVGPVYTREESEKLGLPVKPDGNNGLYRRVVPSPKPVKMVESQLQAVRTLTDSNCVVICAGGGGIPVIEESNGCYKGIEAVIDKDRAAAMVGVELNAHALVILTDVPAVSTNFGKPTEKKIKQVSIKTLQIMMEEGHFPPGSMLPKIESAIDFVTKSNVDTAWAAIGSLNDADKIMAGEAGTSIRRMDDPFVEFYD